MSTPVYSPHAVSFAIAHSREIVIHFQLVKGILAPPVNLSVHFAITIPTLDRLALNPLDTIRA